MEKTGVAYGFIRCDKSLNEIERTLPFIRKDARVPSKLELSVKEGISNVKGNKLLHDTVVRDLKEEGQCNYAFEARLQGVDNQDAAEELGAIFNQAYQSPLFEPRPQDFYATIVYERNGQYHELE